MATATETRTKKSAFQTIAQRNLAEWIKSGRATLQEIAMRSIPDTDRFQCRVEGIDMEHVNQLRTVLDNGGDLAPIVVFEDATTGERFVGDGHHRKYLKKKLGAKSIRAYVVKTDDLEAEATEFAANINATLAKPMTTKDRINALRKLLAIPGNLAKSQRDLSEITGLSFATVKKQIGMFCAEQDIDIPREYTDREGKTRFKPSRNTRRIRSNGTISIKGKKSLYVPIGKRDNLQEFLREHGAIDDNECKFSTTDIFYRWAQSRGLLMTMGGDLRIGGLVAVGGGARIWFLPDGGSLMEVAGKIALADTANGEHLRPVLVINSWDKVSGSMSYVLSLMQSTWSDLMVLAVVEFREQFGPKDGAPGDGHTEAN